MNSLFSKDPIYSHIFFNKFQITKKIGHGTFGNVYEAKNIIDKTQVAMKLEKRLILRSYLKNEYPFLYQLEGLGIPKLISFGTNLEYNILVMELLGQSLESIRLKNGKKFNIKDTCMIGIQTIERIEFIHSKYIIHRDINSANLLLGKDNPYLIYLIDFGFAKKYRSSTSGKHIKYGIVKIVEGTDLFLSTNATCGVEQSRRDDLESLCYTLIFLLKGSLPWQKFDKISDVKTKYNKIYVCKKEISPNQLCDGLPDEFKEFVTYCKSLGFEQDPNYDYLKGLLQNVLIKKNCQIDFIFSWTNKNKWEKFKKKLFHKNSNDNKNNSIEAVNKIYKSNINEKIENRQGRLFRRIERKIGFENNNEKNEINGNCNPKDNNDHNLNIIWIKNETIEINKHKPVFSDTDLNENLAKKEVKKEIKNSVSPINNNNLNKIYLQKINDKKINSIKDTLQNNENNNIIKTNNYLEEYEIKNKKINNFKLTNKKIEGIPIQK